MGFEKLVGETMFKWATIIFLLCTFSVFSCTLVDKNTDENDNGSNDKNADTTGPRVSVSSAPQTSAEGDTVTVTATASDSSGISSVELYVDGSKVKTCPESTTCSFSDSSYSVGSHDYYAIAVDASPNANRARSAIKSFSVSGDMTNPDISVTHTPQAPSEGETVTIAATASDPSGVSGIELYVDGAEVKECPNSTTCSFSGSSYSAGSHTYYAIAVDASLNANQSQSEVENFNVTGGNSTGGVFKIMPLGDSITEAFGYRIPLWDKLTEEGYDIDYVGSRSDSHPDLPDPDHEGHGGWYIGHLSNNINGWLAIYQPDIVLLMIGTNDVAWWCSRNGAQVADDHAALVDQILEKAPDAWVLVASIPPQSSEIIGPNNVDRAQLTKDFNAGMKQRIQARIDNGKQVIFVDVHSLLTVNDLSDGIHPNDGGYEIIAQAWYETLLSVLP